MKGFDKYITLLTIYGIGVGVTLITLPLMVIPDVSGVIAIGGNIFYWLLVGYGTNDLFKKSW